jgi:hypothetical protein
MIAAVVGFTLTTLLANFTSTLVVLLLVLDNVFLMFAGESIGFFTTGSADFCTVPTGPAVFSTDALVCEELKASGESGTTLFCNVAAKELSTFFSTGFTMFSDAFDDVVETDLVMDGCFSSAGFCNVAAKEPLATF